MLLKEDDDELACSKEDRQELTKRRGKKHQACGAPSFLELSLNLSSYNEHSVVRRHGKRIVERSFSPELRLSEETIGWSNLSERSEARRR